MDLDPLEDPELELDSDPAWIRIHMIPIPALLDMISDPDSYPAKNGVVTPLVELVSELMGSLKLGNVGFLFC